MNKTIFFIRHAESEANIGGVSRPNAEIEISDKGKKQAENIATSFEHITSKIYISEFIRTYQTAEPYIKKHHIQYEKLGLLNEFNTFGFEKVKGLNGNQRLPLTIKYWKAKDPNVRMGETGQTFNEFNQQVHDFILCLPTLEDQSVIFGHGMFLSLLSWQLMGFYEEDVAPESMGLFFKYHCALPTPNTVCYKIICNNDVSQTHLRYITSFHKVK